MRAAGTIVCTLCLLLAAGCGDDERLSLEPLPRIAPEVETPAGVDPVQTAFDQTYGYRKANPILLGPIDAGMTARQAEQLYLDALVLPDGSDPTFRRDGNVGKGEDGHVITRYSMFHSNGERIAIFIDSHHPDHDPRIQLAPVGYFMLSEKTQLEREQAKKAAAEAEEKAK